MNVYKLYQRNSKAEKEGVWFTLDAGLRVKMRRQGGDNEAYYAAVTRHSKAFKGKKVLDNKEATEVWINILLDSVIVDWEGFTDKSGNSLPFNEKNARKIFQDLPELFEDVRDLAQTRSAFQKESEDETVKN